METLFGSTKLRVLVVFSQVFLAWWLSSYFRSVCRFSLPLFVSGATVLATVCLTLSPGNGSGSYMGSADIIVNSLDGFGGLGREGLLFCT